MEAFLLAVRLLGLGSGFGRVRAASQVAASALAAFGVLCLMLAPSAIHLRQERADARFVVAGHSRSGLHAEEYDTRWRGAPLSRILIRVDGTVSPPIPPGLGRLPQPGGAIVSPNFERELRRHPAIRGFLSGTRVEGVIKSAGLLGPTELRVYVGVGPGVRVSSAKGFGGQAPPVTVDPGIVAPMLALFSILTVLPALLLAAIATRLGAAVKSRRIRLLATLGMTPTQLRALLITETALCSLVGSLIGVLALLFARGVLETVPGTGLSIFPGDLHLGPVQVLVPLIGIPFAMTLVSSTTARRSGAESTLRPTLGVRSSSSLGLYVLGAGLLATFILIPAANQLSAGQTFRLACFATVATMAGIYFGLPVMIQWGSRIGLRASLSATHVIALRWLETSPGRAARVASGGCVGLLALGMALPAIGELSSSPPSGAHGILAGRGVTLLVERLNGAASNTELSRLQGVSAVFPIGRVHDQTGLPIDVVVGDCAELNQVVDQVDGCTDAPRWLAVNGIPLAAFFDHLPRTLSNGALRLKAPPLSKVVRARLHPSLQGALVVPHGNIAGKLVGHRLDAALVTLTGFGDVDLVESELAAVAPQSTVDSGYLSWVDEASAFQTPAGLLRVELLLGLFIVFLALVVALLSDAREQLARSGVLSILGASPRVRRRALVIVGALPTAAGATISVLVAVMVSRALTRVDGRAHVAAASYGLIWVCVMTLTLATCGGLALLATPRSEGKLAERLLRS